MIKINKEYLLENINTIIEQKRHYGKSNIGNNKKILLTTYIPSISDITKEEYLSTIVYIDNMSRLYSSLGYYIYKEIFITDSKVENTIYIKKILDKYRIDINNYLDKNTLYNRGIVEETLLKYKYTSNCYIKDNSLYLNLKNSTNIELTDNEGNYSELLYLISYNYYNLSNYNEIITILPNNNIYSIENLKPSIEIISNLNKNLNIKIVNPIIEKNNINNINITRYNQSKINISSNDITYNIIENTNIKISNLLHRKEIQKKEKYETIKDEISYNILNNLYEFPDIVLSVPNNKNIGLIANYIDKLTILLNSYLNKNKIEKTNSIYTQEQLSLVYAAKIVLNNALDLIGIIPLDY